MSIRKKILIVEDSPLNRKVLNKFLADDYHIVEAENGQQALDILKNSWEKISLILLDLIMPVMDGHTFLSIVKNDPHYSTIPIIVTTANDSETAEVQALSCGATDFIRKPYHWQVVKHRVKSIITLRETAAMINLIKYDHLTGLYSRDYFYKAASEEIAMNPDRSYDIICCDIENFSLINDAMGYDTGNRVLKATAECLTAYIPDNIICARMNSDVYAILSPYRESYSYSFFSKTVDELNRRINLGNIVLNFGIYHYIKTDSSVYTAFNCALSVVGKIKNQFTTHFALYDDEFHRDKMFAQRITATMEQALKDHEFTVYYQPKFDLHTGDMLGAEALVRWMSPTEGFLHPGKFIPLFEKNGFITELDKYVWEQACIFLRNSTNSGLAILPISVNVSRLDLYNTNITETLLSLIKKYDLQPHNLHLEITESAYNEHPDQLIGITKKLHDLGFILEMDDFGTGYSSLNMLSEMALDVLKLDIRFAQKDALDKKQNEVLSSIVELARRINLTIISEGVETYEQVDNLKKLGCSQAQGYYFSKPISSEEYKFLLEKLS